MLAVVISWVIGSLVLLLISIPINGLLISATWRWFIVPITGVRETSVVEGIGLAIFCSVIGTLATAHLKEWKFSDSTDASTDWRIPLAGLFGTMIGVGVLGPLLVLGIAWVWHTFFMSGDYLLYLGR